MNIQKDRFDILMCVISGGLLILALLFIGAGLYHTRTESDEPKPQIERTLSLPEQCAHLYNVGRHKEWADCMGVGYK